MKFYIIGEREIVLAFKLTGIEGTAAETRAEVLDAFNRVTGKGGVVNVPSGEIPRVLILTEQAASQIEEEEIVPEEGFSYVFKIASEDTKSIFGDNHIVWENGDQVASYASTSKNKSTDVEVDGSDVTITIRSSVALSAGDMVYAYAPYNKVNNEAEATAVTLEIPRNQVSGSASAMPLVALPFELDSAVEKYTDTEVGTLPSSRSRRGRTDMARAISTRRCNP